MAALQHTFTIKKERRIQMERIGFIGMGNMGYAMLKGALSVFAPEELIFTAKTRETKLRVFQETGVTYAESNAECANDSKYVILAVKPQYYDSVMKNLRYTLTPEHVVISLAPGISIANLKERLGQEIRIMRAMPNTPALLGEGMTGLVYDAEEYTEQELQTVHKLMNSFGKFQVIEERLMNALICASGSSPAFVYMFIEALADGAVKYGMPRDKAYALAAQAVKGSAEMVLQTGEHPGLLKDKVCSPGGTTIAGVAALEEYGFRNAVLKACDACYEKSESMNPKS